MTQFEQLDLLLKEFGGTIQTFQVYTVKKQLHEIGITTMQTSFGHSVPVYDMERTICDLLRSRKNIEIQVLQDALKQYARRKDKNLPMEPRHHICIECQLIFFLRLLLSKM